MFQFQELTAPIKSIPSNTTQTPPTSAPVRQDSPFLVLTHEPETPKVPLRPLTNFLVLSPVHSSTYPIAPPRRSSVASTGSRKSSLSSTSDLILPEPKPRRRSSVSSASSDGKQQRFLRLNPVHWGGEEGEDDYAIDE